MPKKGDAFVNVLGVAVSAVDMKSATNACERLISNDDRGYVCVTGVHGVMEAQQDPRFLSILNQSFLTVPDGMPLVWVGKLRGFRRMGRVYGPDFMLEFCRQSVPLSYRHFLYGGKPGVVEDLARKLSERVPGLQIVGMYTPPFRALEQEEEDELFERVRACTPDVVWVGLSTPKQERFMAQYGSRLDAKLLVGVGAAFDLHTGQMKDAPQWMKQTGLQWLHRLVQEPRRLLRRYAVNNPKFLFKIALQFAGIARYSPRNVSPTGAD